MIDIVIIVCHLLHLQVHYYISFENSLAIRAKGKLFNKHDFVDDFVVIFLHHDA